jgi:hypothetical protein
MIGHSSGDMPIYYLKTIPRYFFFYRKYRAYSAQNAREFFDELWYLTSMIFDTFLK